jgi:hypothetical protein
MKYYNYITQSRHSLNKSDNLNEGPLPPQKPPEVRFWNIMQVNIVQIDTNEFWTTVLMCGNIKMVTKIPKH